uniref:Uncharacterized protein n=1 Tax=Mustela putorius furo TaxID=9669 RepID=M3Z8X7_MUSPF
MTPTFLLGKNERVLFQPRGMRLCVLTAAGSPWPCTLLSGGRSRAWAGMEPARRTSKLEAVVGRRPHPEMPTRRSGTPGPAPTGLEDHRVGEAVGSLGRAQPALGQGEAPGGQPVPLPAASRGRTRPRQPGLCQALGSLGWAGPQRTHACTPTRAHMAKQTYARCRNGSGKTGKPPWQPVEKVVFHCCDVSGATCLQNGDSDGVGCGAPGAPWGPPWTVCAGGLRPAPGGAPAHRELQGGRRAGGPGWSPPRALSLRPCEVHAPTSSCEVRTPTSSCEVRTPMSSCEVRAPTSSSSHSRPLHACCGDRAEPRPEVSPLWGTCLPSPRTPDAGRQGDSREPGCPRTCSPQTRPDHPTEVSSGPRDRVPFPGSMKP